jgi:uncharacterized membrane protein
MAGREEGQTSASAMTIEGIRPLTNQATQPQISASTFASELRNPSPVRERRRVLVSNKLSEKPNAEPLPESADAGVMLNGRYKPPPADKDGTIWVRTTALIQAEAQDLYAIWRNVEAAPLWQEQIKAVRKIGPSTYHWTMDSGEGKTIEWDAEILADEPGKRIAWRSIAGDSQNAGEVVFSPAVGERGTLVTVLQEFRMGKVASAWETIVGRNPKQAVIENLRHFKAFAETEEIPRTTGQPHGPRGTIAKMKASLYGENTPTPAGLERKAS